jgi:hypothetical protein
VSLAHSEVEIRHIDNVKGSDINQSDMGHDTDGERP